MYWYLVVEPHDQEHNGRNYIFSRRIEFFAKREQEAEAAAAYTASIYLVILYYYYIRIQYIIILRATYIYTSYYICAGASSSVTGQTSRVMAAANGLR